MRNPQVARKLNQWRREQTTYFSYLPQDVVGLILPYLPPHVWAEELVLTPQAKCLLPSGLGNVDFLILADNSYVVTIPEYCCFYLEAGTKNFVQLTDLSSDFYALAADPSRGFWYTSSQTTSLTVPNFYRQFDPKTQIVLKEVLLPTPYRHHFAVTPDGILVFTPSSVQEFTLEGQLIQQTELTGNWVYRNGALCQDRDNKYIYRNMPWGTNSPLEVPVAKVDRHRFGDFVKPFWYDPATKDLYLASNENLLVQVEDQVFKLIDLPPNHCNRKFKRILGGQWSVLVILNRCLTIYTLN